MRCLSRPRESSVARAGAILFLLLIGPLFVLPALAQQTGWEREWPQTDFSRHAVDLSEILSGGPPRDGIPSIDAPEFVTIAEAGLPPLEPVISVLVGGVARAYPLRVMMWHEIVNDTVGGVPLAITYCPLCNTGIVFQRALGEQLLDFGTTGKLRNSDLVMYDRQTESWWQQFTGRAIVGEMTGTTLEPWPSRLESMALFAQRHPDGLVLVPSSPGSRAYGANPYVGYDRRSTPYDFFEGDLPQGIAPLARVVRVEETAWSLDLLRDLGRIEHGDLVLTWQPGQVSALDERVIAQSFDVGNVVVQRLTQSGPVDVPYSVDFAFAFHAFYPDAPIVTE